MKFKDALISLLAIGVITALGAWAYLSVSRPSPDVCRVCQRGMHQGVTYRLELASEIEDACCPRCGMHYQIEHPGTVKKALATDLNTGHFITAEKATYVEGGNVAYCTMHSTPVERQPQGVAVRDFDRCLPSLVAFRMRQEAETYQKQHGGEVLEYSQAMERVKAL
jgi:hypothetical protein